MSRGQLVSRSAAGATSGQPLGYADAGLHWPLPAGTRAEAPIRHWSAHWRLIAFVVLGASAAGVVGYLAAQNPHAAPAHVAVVVRVAIIATLVVAGAYARSNTRHARLGAGLVAAGLYASLWLLNGSREPLLFSLGMLLSGLAPTVFAYLLLAYPSGRLRSGAERRLLLWAGGAMMLFWAFLVLTSGGPPIRTPLLDCGTHCPHNALFVGASGGDAASVATTGVWVSWAMIVCATPVLLFMASRRGSEPVRRSFVPIEVAAITAALLWLGFTVARLADAKAAGALGAAYAETPLAVPIVILAGLFVERLSMGRALTRFVNGLAERPNTVPSKLLAETLHDPSLRIAYYERRTGMYVDTAGRPVPTPRDGAGRAIARIEREGGQAAVVGYDAQLTDQAAFVGAAGAVALMHFEAGRLQNDLTESNRKLAASRRRLVDAADAERQRIERDLHDGVQQHIVGLRLRLDLAAQAVHDDAARGERMLGVIGGQVDELLAVLRSFAAGIYPSVLTERGLKDALESVVRAAPIPMSVQTFALERYAEDVEVAVYFCCVEAIQNVVKHAGPDPAARLRLWQIGDSLAFELRDSGAGFHPVQSHTASGLTNMHDRIEAIGGRVTVSAKPGGGTWVRGRVPLG